MANLESNSRSVISADEQALLAAIVAHPDEDTPRLIYADWLDEHAGALSGRDPKEMRARAEFIRAQIEVARLSPGDPATGPLNARIEQLLLWYGPEWCNRDARSLVRGFPIAVHVDYLSEVCGKAEHLLSRYPIQVVYANEAFSRDTEEEVAVASSPRFAQFTALGSTHRGWDGDRVAKVLTNPHLTNLRVLDLYGGRYNGPGGAEGIAAATHLTNLLALDLSGNKIDDEGLEALAGAVHLASLRCLRLGRDSSGGANGITERGVEALARARCFPALTQLALDGNGITAGGVEHILNAEWASTLTELNLAEAWISEAGLVALARSSRLPNLRRLDVSANEVTETVARAFLQSESLPNLVDLHLIGHHEFEEPITEPTQAALRERFGPNVIDNAWLALTATCVEDALRERL